jgi:hypothetical protein
MFELRSGSANFPRLPIRGRVFSLRLEQSGHKSQCSREKAGKDPPTQLPPTSETPIGLPPNSQERQLSITPVVNWFIHHHLYGEIVG